VPCPAGKFFKDYGPGKDSVPDDGAEADAGSFAVCQVIRGTEYSGCGPSSLFKKKIFIYACCLICYIITSFRPPFRCYALILNLLVRCSFYIHRSSMYLVAPENVHHPDNPLRVLFKLLRRFGVPEN